MRFLLDTSIVSAAVWKLPDPRVLARLLEHGSECAIAAPVWHELQFGCRRLPRGKRRRAIEGYLEDVVRPTMPILGYDERAASWHALERVRLTTAGRIPPFVDGQIAAIAAVNELALVTLNLKDFRTFRGLDLIDWTKP
jgi:tRNA(fMet)-specific endonuclease VapC